jgi:hypothetical protein
VNIDIAVWQSSKCEEGKVFVVVKEGSGANCAFGAGKILLRGHSMLGNIKKDIVIKPRRNSLVS